MQPRNMTCYMRCLRFYALLALLSMLPVAAYALGIDTPLSDSAQEARARDIFYQLRCVVCQGESIADSPAGIASDMRREIRRQIAAGVRSEDIVADLVSRYGDFILMAPPLNRATAPLWFGPFILLGFALTGALVYFRQSRKKKAT